MHETIIHTSSNTTTPSSSSSSSSTCLCLCLCLCACIHRRRHRHRQTRQKDLDLSRGYVGLDRLLSLLQFLELSLSDGGAPCFAGDLHGHACEGGAVGVEGWLGCCVCVCVCVREILYIYMYKGLSGEKESNTGTHIHTHTHTHLAPPQQYFSVPQHSDQAVLLNLTPHPPSSPPPPTSFSLSVAQTHPPCLGGG